MRRLPTTRLSPREKEVLRAWITEGTYRRVGEVLFITEQTVKHHAENIMLKLGVSRFGQAAVLFDRMERG